MRTVGVVLIGLGFAWIVMCFVGTEMMSRSVDFLEEAFLPSIVGVVVAGVGLWLCRSASAPDA
jgi:hypothetical protein